MAQNVGGPIKELTIYLYLYVVGTIVSKYACTNIKVQLYHQELKNDCLSKFRVGHIGEADTIFAYTNDNNISYR